MLIALMAQTFDRVTEGAACAVAEGAEPASEADPELGEGACGKQRAARRARQADRRLSATQRHIPGL